jgi:hypothetical protein
VSELDGDFIESERYKKLINILVGGRGEYGYKNFLFPKKFHVHVINLIICCLSVFFVFASTASERGKKCDRIHFSHDEKKTREPPKI